MDITQLSKKYLVKEMTNKDIDAIYALCTGNPLYYQYCPPYVTKESIEEDLNALPPKVTKERKHYVGFYEGDTLVAVMDLIEGYPEKEIAFIGFFMMNANLSKKGIGSDIITELTTYLRELKYERIRLAWVKGNPQAEHFWTKNGFVAFKETTATNDYNVMLADKLLPLIEQF